MKNFALALTLALSLSACKYSNTFEGTLNGNKATMDAYSKNINKYCVALTIKSGTETKESYISAQDVFDPNDFLKPTSFNTKGAECGANLDEYLVGTRNTTVMNISYVTVREQVSIDYCRYTTYKNYQYKEDITFDLKNKATDVTTGTFTGVGEVANYTDTAHPTNYGPIFFCRTTGPRPFPYLNIGGGVTIHVGPRR